MSGGRSASDPTTGEGQMLVRSRTSRRPFSRAGKNSQTVVGRRSRLRWALPFAAGFVEILTFSAVSAQTVARPSTTVDEIVVTAEKTTQTLEKAPASITAFSSDTLASR